MLITKTKLNKSILFTIIWVIALAIACAFMFPANAQARVSDNSRNASWKKCPEDCRAELTCVGQDPADNQYNIWDVRTDTSSYSEEDSGWFFEKWRGQEGCKDLWFSNKECKGKNKGEYGKDPCFWINDNQLTIVDDPTSIGRAIGSSTLLLNYKSFTAHWESNVNNHFHVKGYNKDGTCICEAKSNDIDWKDGKQTEEFWVIDASKGGDYLKNPFNVNFGPDNARIYKWALTEVRNKV